MTEPLSSPWRRLAASLSLAALVLLGLALAWHSISDLDLPLHDRTGRDILAGQGIPRTNTYSFTAPQTAWLDHEWLFQVTVAGAGGPGDGRSLGERSGGWIAVRLVLTACLLAALAFPWWRQREMAARALPWLGPVALLGLAMLWTRLTLRPELGSFVLLVLLLGRVEATLAKGAGPTLWRQLLDPRRPGGQALILTLVWYQWHGFAALALPLWLLAGWLAPAPGLSPVQRWRLALTGLLLALVAGLLTPNGLQGLLYPLRALGQFGESGVDLREVISELVPLLETRGSLALTLLAFKVSLVWGALWIVLGWGRVSRLRAALWLLAAFAAWQGQRNLGFYAVAFLLLHGGQVPARTPWDRLRERCPWPGQRRTGLVLTGLATALAWLTIGWWLLALASDTFYLREGVARRWGTGLTPATYPEQQAVRLAVTSPGRVANTVDAAATLVAAGAGPIAIDGRTEAYPTSVWRDYAELKSGGAPALNQLRQWRAAAVCLAHRNTAAHPLLRTLHEADEWSLSDVDAAGATFVRRGDAAPDRASSPLWPAVSAFRMRLAETRPGPDVRLADEAAAWAALLNLLGDQATGEQLLDLGLEHCPDHPTLHHNKGNQLLARGEFAAALGHFETAARLNRNAAPPLVNAGNCLFRLGQPRDAVEAFVRATRRDPRNFEAWANLAEVERRRGNRQAAARAYARALELRPDDQRLRARARELGR
jgi:hypothetical protein